MNSTSVDLTFSTFQSTLPPGKEPVSAERMRELLEAALVEGGALANGQPVLLQVMSDKPGESFSMSVAPQLASPSIDGETLTVDTALALLTHLQTTLFQLNLVSNSMRAQIESLTQAIKLTQQRDDNLEKIDAQMRAREASGVNAGAEAGALAGSVIGAAIALGLAALFTGGLALALAGVAVTMAVLEMGSAIAKAAGAMTPPGYNGQQRPLDFTVGGMTQMAIDHEVKSGQIVIAEKRGDVWVDHSGKVIPDPTGKPGVTVMNQKQFNEYYAYTGMAFTLLLGVGMMAGGFAATRMAVDLAKFAANVTKLNALLGTTMSTRYVQQVATGVEVATSVTEGSTNVINGGTQVNLAVLKHALDEMTAALEYLQSQIDFMTQHQQLLIELTKKQAEAHNESVVATIRTIGGFHKGMEHIAHNLTPMS